MKTTIKTLTVTGAALAAVLTLQTSAHAQVLASDTFNTYTAGNTLVGDNGGSGWGGAWGTSQPSVGYIVRTDGPGNNGVPLAYPNDTLASGGNYINLASGFGADQTLTASRKLNTAAGGSFATNGLATGGLIGANNATLWGSFQYSNDVSNNGVNSTLRLNLNGGTNGGNNSFNLSRPQSNNLLVFRIDYGSTFSGPGANDTITLWTDPNLTSATTFAASSSATFSGNYSFTTLNLQTTYSGGDQSAFKIDDTLFGKSLQDVTGVTPLAAPEPSSIALLGMGLLGLFTLLRRKQTA